MAKEGKPLTLKEEIQGIIDNECEDETCKNGKCEFNVDNACTEPEVTEKILSSIRSRIENIGNPFNYLTMSRHLITNTQVSNHADKQFWRL